MHAQDLAVFLRRWKGDANAVAFHHILNQDELAADDDAFLRKHLQALDFEVLVCWLARKPKTPKPIVDRLTDVWPIEKPGLLLRFCLQPRAAAIDPDAYDDLLERVRARTEPRLWWSLAKSLTGMCPTFGRALEVKHAPELVAALFPHRRDERACRAEVLRLAHEGGVVVHGPSWSLNRSTESDLPAAPLRDRASVVFWMEEAHLLDELSPGQVLPDEVMFPCEHEDRHWGHQAQEYLLRLALRWPGLDRNSARGWYMDQVLRAARRGARWEGLLHDIVGRTQERYEPQAVGKEATRLIDDIAWRSFGSEVEAPWVGYAVCRALLRREPDAWDRAFRFLERRDLHFSEDQVQQTFPWALLVAALHENADEMPAKPVPHWIPKWILLHAPLPDVVDETFDGRLLSFASDMQGDSPGALLSWVLRLADLPLTRPRANRLLGMVLSSQDSLRRATTELLSKLAEAADTPVEQFPEADVLFNVRSRIEPARIAAYRKLAGAEAHERLRRWMRAPLDMPENNADAGPWNAAERMRSVPDLAPAGLAEEIVERARRELVLDLLLFQREFPELISEAMVVAVATERVNDADERWVFFDKVELPEDFADLALQRCHAPIEAREVAALGRWLLGLGRDPRLVLSCLLSRSPRLPWEGEIQRLLREILSSRSRWETYGPAIFRTMLDDGAKGAIWSLVNAATSDRDGEVAPGIVTAIHEALAVALLERAAAAIGESDEGRAVPALHAIVALHPPARLSGKLRPMIAKTQPGGEARDLVELNLRLLRRSKTRDARPTDVLSALQILAEPHAD